MSQFAGGADRGKFDLIFPNPLWGGQTQVLHTQSVNVGNVSAATLDGLNDCTTYHVAVKAYNHNAESQQYGLALVAQRHRFQV